MAYLTNCIKIEIIRRMLNVEYNMYSVQCFVIIIKERVHKTDGNVKELTD